jgi:hypothetical protein
MVVFGGCQFASQTPSRCNAEPFSTGDYSTLSDRIAIMGGQRLSRKIAYPIRVKFQQSIPLLTRGLRFLLPNENNIASCLRLPFNDRRFFHLSRRGNMNSLMVR